MKNFFLLCLTALSSTVALGQNTAVINQQGSSHDVSVVQRGTDNTSVVTQSTARPGNRATVVQAGPGNVATIHQGTGSDSTTNSVNSVNTTQSGEGETIINQTNGGNSISVFQSDGKPTDRKKKSSRKKTGQ